MALKDTKIALCDILSLQNKFPECKIFHNANQSSEQYLDNQAFENEMIDEWEW